MINPLNLLIFVIFGFTQLIPLKYEQISVNATSSPFQNSMKKGMIMLSVRLVYFVILAKGISIIWMRGW